MVLIRSQVMDLVLLTVIGGAQGARSSIADQSHIIAAAVIGRPNPGEELHQTGVLFDGDLNGSQVPRIFRQELNGTVIQRGTSP